MISKFDEFKPNLNNIRTKLKLSPLNKTVDLMDMADFRILQTLKDFDFPIKPAPKNVRYTGPILDDPDWVGSVNGISPWKEEKNHPLVVVSFSSTFQNQFETLQNCIDALKNLPVRGLVTLGLAMEDLSFNVPENVKLVNSVQHSMVFPHADIVITHGGHGTVMRALANGVPLICLPMGRDQKDNAVKVEIKGCGITMSSKSKPVKIKKAIEKILKEPEYKTSAIKLKKELMASQGMEDTLLEIETSVNGYKNNHS